MFSQLIDEVAWLRAELEAERQKVAKLRAAIDEALMYLRQLPSGIDPDAVDPNDTRPEDAVWHVGSLAACALMNGKDGE